MNHLPSTETTRIIILDTNVVSETKRPVPNPIVVQWVAENVRANLFITAITEAELRYGLAIMPVGHRREDLTHQTEEMLRDDFEGKILPFDSVAARAYPEIAVSRRRAGRPIKQHDAQIAAIARVHNAIVATRNISDFTECGVELINPWSTEGTLL